MVKGKIIGIVSIIILFSLSGVEGQLPVDENVAKELLSNSIAPSSETPCADLIKSPDKKCKLKKL